MWQKARDTEAAAASAAAAAASANTTSSTSSAANSGGTRGRGRGRGGVKRRATDQPEGQSTPKRSTRNTDDSSQLLHSLSMAPAPAKGLLASAAEADLPPEGTPAEDESPSGSPEPTNLANGSAPSASQTKQQGKVHAREKSPALPKNVAEPDDFGVRIYNQRPSFRDKGLNSRLLAPSCLVFDDLDIGFRDSSNDSSKGHTRTKRGKYLDTPNSNGFHFDHWCNGFDYSTTKAGDFNKALVKRHSVHPTYGVFLPGSTNEQEDQTTLIMPGKPVVFIANPSGRISHASRGYQQTANHNRLVDSPWRHKMGASLRRFCKVDGDTDPQDIDITDRLASDDELRERSLGTALKELETRATGSDDSSDIDMEAAGESEEAIASRDAAEEVRPDLSSLTYAAAFIEASEAPRATPAPPKPANAKYDAVRDMFVSEAEPPAVQLPVQQETVALNFLADLCNSTPRNLMLAPLREDDAVDNFVRPAPPLPPPAMSEYELPPVLSERESSYVPPTPTQSIRDIMQEAPEPTLQSLPPRAPSLPPPPMHHQHQHQQQPLHHYVREESGPYLPHARQSTHASHSEASHYGQDYAASTHAPLPPVAPGPAPAQEYPPSQQHHYAQSPLENGYAQPLPHNGYSVAEMQPQSQHPPSHSYEHSLNHRPMSSFAPNDNPYARTAWSQHPPPPPPPPGPLAHSSVSMQTPAPSHGYPSQPPPINTPRPSFSHHPVGEPLPPLRPPRGRHQSMPPSIYDESLVDPSLRSGPPPPLNGYGNYYPAPSHGYQHNYGPAEQQHHSYQHRHSDRILPAPQQPPPHHQGYMASPPPPSHAYHASIPSPTMGSMQLGGQGMSPQDPPHHHAFHHRSTGSGSGAGLPPPGDANSKYRKLQPAPIPAHRNWSSNKPELKTIPYDHKDSTGVSGAAALPNSGPTTIRGWNVNPQRRRPRSDRRENADAVNERDDSR